MEHNTEEVQYLDLLKRILVEGIETTNRTSVTTLSVFGAMLKFDLSKGFPLLTTKKMFWKGVCEELLWFISGNTNALTLSDKGIHIWDGNSSREYLDSRGFINRQVGDLGPVYGFQWRHFGAEYIDCNTNYDNQGVDQLKWCIEQIKSNPASRQIIMSAWNPCAISQMALPPCHMICHFRVIDGRLNCSMFQRSADMGLGVPFNIASYALLTHLVAAHCGLKVGALVMMLSDAHIYSNHVAALKKQIERVPYAFPQIEITQSDLFKCTSADIKVHNYVCHPAIRMDMVI